ncbi:MAG: aminotransferase class IV [Aphanocapsa sp. GSE-SYN-MK-11-07L]|jgi:branched-chain amino acid aminotransferase|nr:aminotransferase class IV [Aphanocapsa sp. GSE-SYN-MK-11-07L]
MGLLINLDGVISPAATISVLDRGFLYGDSVYEVVRTFNRQPVGLQEHLDRLRRSAAYLYLAVPWSDRHLKQEVDQTLQQATGEEFYIRIVVTRGADQTIALLPSAQIQPSLMIVVSAIDPQPKLSETGLHLQIVDRIRNHQQALSPAAKTGNYLNNILGLLEARQQGADDALMLNPQGEIAEATTSNLWLVQDGIVKTPRVEAGILHGITRAFLLQILRDRQIPHQETTLKPADLWLADEAFLSSSVRLLMPINQINDYQLPQCPSSMTRFLWDQLLMLMQDSTQD